MFEDDAVSKLIQTAVMRWKEGQVKDKGTIYAHETQAQHEFNSEKEAVEAATSEMKRAKNVMLSDMSNVITKRLMK